MNANKVFPVDWNAYHPPPEDEFGLTPRQIHERSVSRRIVSLLRYDAEMTREKAEAIMALPLAALMRQLEIDEKQAKDLKKLAERHLKRCELAEEETGSDDRSRRMLRRQDVLV